MSGDDPGCRRTRSCVSMYSPHERGWSLNTATTFIFYFVFPAWAGMILVKGMELSNGRCIPRMSGDDPQDMWKIQILNPYSPHERGWSWRIRQEKYFCEVFPAWAGMILWIFLSIMEQMSIPRMSGDDPSLAISFSFSSKYSPHERGWS